MSDRPEWRAWINLGWYHLSVGRKPLFRIQDTDYFVVGFGVERV